MTVSADRFLFPEDRTAFIYQRPGEPILTPYRTGIQLFLDEAAQSLADIVDENNQPVQYSTIYTGSDSLLPLFYGPPNYVTIVWGKVVGGDNPTYPLTAQYGAQLQLVPTLLTGSGAPTTSIGVPGSMYIDEDAHKLYGPRTSVWPTQGFLLQGPQGIQGPQGAQGSPGGYYEYAQITPSSTWVINHPLTYRPNVTVVDSAGFEVWGDVSYPLPGRVVVQFSSQFGGTALLS